MWRTPVKPIRAPRCFGSAARKPPWLSTFESEVAAVPNGKHDNKVDSLTQFLRALDFGLGPLRHVSFFAGEGEGKTDGTATTFRWTSRPKEALLWGKRASRARLPRPVIRRGLPGWKRRDCRGTKPEEAPK